MARPTAALGLAAVLSIALVGCAPGAVADDEPGSSTQPSTSADPSPSEPATSEEPEGIDTSDWLEYVNTEGDVTYRYPADWTLAAEAEPNAYAEPGFHAAWDSASLTAPNGQTLLRSGDFADIGGYCPPGSGARVEVLATEPSPVQPIEDSGDSVIATVAFPLPEGGWTFGVGITSTGFLGDDGGMACSVYFVSMSSSGGVWFGTQSIVGSAEERSELWEIASLDEATAYMETDEYATIVEILRSVVTS